MCVSDIRYHQQLASPQPMNLKNEFSPLVPTVVGLNGYALLVTNTVISIIIDGQGQFDIF